MADTNETPPSAEEYRQFVDTIIAQEYLPNIKTVNVRTKDGVCTAIPEELYVEFGLIVKRHVEKPNCAITVPEIVSAQMAHLLNLVKIFIYSDYNSKFVKEGALNCYFEDIWVRPIEDGKLPPFMLMANAAEYMEIVELLDPISHFLANKLTGASTGAEYCDFLIRSGWPNPDEYLNIIGAIKDTSEPPTKFEEHNNLMDIILAHEFLPSESDVVFMTKGGHRFLVAEALYMKFKAVTDVLEKTPFNPEKKEILSLQCIAWKPMQCLLDLVSILAYDRYSEELTKTGVLNVYFEYSWGKEIEGTNLTEFTLIANAAKLLKVEELYTPIRRFFLGKLAKTTTREEYYECMVHIGYPWSGNCLSEIIDEIKKSLSH